MARDTNPPVRKAEDDLREIPRWARCYAQNRTLPVVAFLLIFAVGACMFGGLSLLTAWAYVADKRVLAAAAMVVLCGLAVFWGWLSFFGGMARTMARIGRCLYRSEGNASIGPAVETTWAYGQQPTGSMLALAFCALAHAGLGVLGVLPIEYLQPISALYVVPLVVYFGLREAPRQSSPFMVLWPALYGLHAVLDVAGVPVRFWGDFHALDIFFPMTAYGLIAALGGHVYSRIALRRLRALAARPESNEGA